MPHTSRRPFRGRNRGPCESHLDQPFGRRPHARETRRVPAGAGAGALGAGAPDRRVGELSRPEGQPEFPRTASAARRHREPYFSGPQGVQRGGQDLQRRRAPLPGQPGGQVVRVRAEALLRGCRRYRNRTPGAVSARLRGRKQRDGTRQRIPSLLCCRCLPTCGFRESGAGRGTG